MLCLRLGFLFTFTRVCDESKGRKLARRGMVWVRFKRCALHRNRNNFSIFFQVGEEDNDEGNGFVLLRFIERRRDGVVGAPRSPLLLILA